MKLRIAQNVLIVFALGIPALIFAALLYQRTAPVADELHAQISTLTATLGETDARLNAAVLRIRLRDSNAAAALRDGLELQRAQLARLDAVLAQIDGGEDLTASVNFYRDSAVRKAELLTTFDRQSGIFDNAYAGAYAGLNGLLAGAAAGDKLRQILRRTLTDLLDYTAAGARAEATPLIQALETLKASRSGGEIQMTVNGVAGHIETILDSKPRLDATLAAADAVSIADAATRLRDSYNVAHSSLVDQNEGYRRALLAYFALLTVGAIYASLRWRSQQVVKSLRSDNTLLEQHVATRTQELTEAYEELQQSQSRLVQSEKMSALGQMVAGVAHEINTPLAYSRSNVDLVKEQLGEIRSLVEAADRQAQLISDRAADQTQLRAQIVATAKIGHGLREDGALDDMSELLEASADGLTQIAEMVMSLKNFSRVDRKPTEQFDLNQGLDSALLIANNKLKHKVEVVKHYGDIPPVTCNPSQINQVFLNMLVNAAQAIDERGVITLTTVASGDHVDVIIEDDGAGIPEDVLANIFDPFFTTKDIGEGTGLGLSICYKIIEQHGGTISVDSQPNQGTRFIISLFIAEDGGDTDAAQRDTAARPALA